MSSEQTPFASPSTASGPEILRVVAFGPPPVVDHYILTQHRLGYAAATEWSPPLPAPTPGQIMRILTKRLTL